MIKKLKGWFETKDPISGISIEHQKAANKNKKNVLSNAEIIPAENDKERTLESTTRIRQSKIETSSMEKMKKSSRRQVERETAYLKKEDESRERRRKMSEEQKRVNEEVEKEREKEERKERIELY